MIFLCRNCNNQFEAEGKKVEYMDPIFGACSKTVSGCPTCGNESREYSKPKPVALRKQQQSACAQGQCCGGGCAF